MVYVERLTELIDELKKEGYILRKFELSKGNPIKGMYVINLPNCDFNFGAIQCDAKSVVGYNADISEIINRYAKPDMIKHGDDALAAIED